MINDKKIGVIGAGIAGLSCSTALQQAGYAVTVFEKSRGVSGRLSTRVYEDWHCDHGAQYFTARDPIFAAEVQRWVNADVATLWEPELAVFDGNTFKPKASPVDRPTLRYVGFPKNHSPAKWLAASLNIVTEATVAEITKNEGKWQVTSKEFGVHSEHFDFIVMAIPAPQAAVLLKGILSPLSEVCLSVTMQPCFALIVNFKHRIHCPFDGLFINQGILSWAARNSSKPGRRLPSDTDAETWVLHATSEWSATNVDTSKDKVSQQMLLEFNQILKRNAHAHASYEQVMSPGKYDVHRWLYAECIHYQNHVFSVDAQNKIGLCGDWLNGGKVQGAWLSGYRLAASLIGMA